MDKKDELARKLALAETEIFKLRSKNKLFLSLLREVVEYTYSWDEGTLYNGIRLAIDNEQEIKPENKLNNSEKET